MAFEETEKELTANVASLGFDLDGLVKRKKMLVDYVHIERSEVQESGEYDLEGLFVRLGHAIDSIGAKRVVLDTLEVLFASLPNEAVLRGELRRLFRWLKDKGVTAVITAERGRENLTRHGLEEYVSDCVILLDHRVNDQIATRHLRVVKYRGALHGTNEFPFLIGQDGISVLPITSLALNHSVSTERIATGIPRLDVMLGGRGFFRGSSILLSGTSGTGKTIIAANFAEAAARRCERVLFFSFEESPNQIIRNMHSIGLRLEPLMKRDLLRIHSARPSLYGLEMHLATIFKEIISFKPHVVIVDPITSLMDLGTDAEGKGMVTRLIDYLKAGQVTSLFTSLTQGVHSQQQTETAMSSLMDAWILLQDFEGNGERNRILYVLKARGMKHSNQIREFLISDHGIDVVDAYIGASGVLTGSARVAQGDLEKAAILAGQQITKPRRWNCAASPIRSAPAPSSSAPSAPPPASCARRTSRTDPPLHLNPNTKGKTHENQSHEAPLHRPRPRLATAPLRDGPVIPLAHRLRQPEGSLRDPPQGPLSHQGDRPAEAPPSCQRPPDPRRAHRGARVARPCPHPHRHSLRHHPRARRPGCARHQITETFPLKTKPSRRLKTPPAPARSVRAAGNYVLRLFVAGATARSRQAVLNVRELCTTELKNRCTFEVIDIYQQPALARENQIVVTPTLIKDFPRPMQRFVGNLANLAGHLVEVDFMPTGKVML